MTLSTKTLVVLDFDYTIIDENSDLYIEKLLPNGTVPPHIREKYKNDDWIVYMHSIFEHLHQNGVTIEKIKECLEEIELTQGMTELFRELAKDDYETIIISDANDLFIEHILQKKQIRDAVRSIFTNPATVDEEGRLHLSNYHTQDWCQLSSKNMCKGHILETFLEERKKSRGISYQKICYIGDGKNDFCPALRLSELDFVFPREGYRLMAEIEKNAKNLTNEQRTLKAQVFPWNSAIDIVEVMKKKG